MIAARVLEFWFGEVPCDAACHAQQAARWFSGQAQLDREIRDSFSSLVVAAASGELEAWTTTPEGLLALCLVLDQFPRHIHRGSGQAFAYDPQALALCERGLALGFDRALGPVERGFLYLPLQHAEDGAVQQRSLALHAQHCEELPPEHWYAPHARRALAAAQLHAAIIERYGRFPHRNAALGRTSSLREALYLAAGGPSFGQSTAAAPVPRFELARPGLPADRTLCVDGRVPGLRCLSHWPGAEVPRALRHDLSTGMAIRWAQLSAAERLQLVGPFDLITNDHYDTDGVLAAGALLHPELAVRHEQRLTRAAASGDFRVFRGEDALALDLSVWALRDSPRSPLAAELRELDQAAASERCYRYALAQLTALVSEPEQYRALWEPQYQRILRELRAVDAGHACEVTELPELDLAVIRMPAPLTRWAIIHAARERSRVLLWYAAADGPRYRFFYRNETWFMGIRERMPPRLPLEAACASLQRKQAGWWCTGIEQTTPQLGFGPASNVADVFGSLRLEADPPSALQVADVVHALAESLAPRRCQLQGAPC